jgi:drug/metabolite transporter (DMT)-like permease
MRYPGPVRDSLPATGTAPAVDNVRGAFNILAACLLFTAMGAIAKVLGERLPAIEVAFGRAFGGLLVVLPLVLRAGPGAWRTSRLGLHVTRGTLGTMALICGFYAVTQLPLAEATALSFTKPLFQVVLAALILREVVRATRWVATVVGFVGVLVMLAPGLAGPTLAPAALVGLAGAGFAAVVSITLRRLVHLEREITILLYLGLTGTLVTGVPTAFVWVTPTALEAGLMLAMAAIGLVSQIFLMRGFRLGEASAMAPFDYSRLPFSAAVGFLVFAEAPGHATFAGAVIVAGSALYVARAEAQAARRTP